MTNLKWADVAHYYAKSKVSIIVGQLDHGSEMGMIFGKGLHENCEYMDHGMWCTVENGAFVSEWGSHKSILRHLDDLTESEARELYEIAMNEEYEGDDCIDWLSTQAHNRETCGLCEFDDIKGNPFAWHYLLSKGFDLFNLIENGEAIRKPLNP